jgi:protein HIRA/HIR1
LTKYGYGRKQTRLPETPAQLQLEEEAIILSKASKRIVAIMDGTSGSSNSVNNSISNIPANIVSSTSTVPTITEQKITIGKNGKKRIQPIMLTTLVTPTQPTIQGSSQVNS